MIFMLEVIITIVFIIGNEVIVIMEERTNFGY